MNHFKHITHNVFFLNFICVLFVYVSKFACLILKPAIMTKVYFIMFNCVHIIGVYSSREIASSWIDHFQKVPDLAGDYTIAEADVYDKKPFDPKSYKL